MIRLTSIIEGSTQEELESLQSLLEPFSSSFTYSIVETEGSEFQLLVQIADGALVDGSLMNDFLAFLALKIAEVNQV
jgi:hypothetical protein